MVEPHPNQLCERLPDHSTINIYLTYTITLLHYNIWFRHHMDSFISIKPIGGAVSTFPALKIFMGGIYALSSIQCNSTPFDVNSTQFKKVSNCKIQHNSKTHWMLESIKVRCDVNILNKGTLGTINIIYLIFVIIYNKIQLYLYVYLFQPLKRLLENHFSDSAKFGRSANLLNLKTV